MKRDLTIGSPARALLTCAAPLLVGSSCNLAATLVDRYWVGALGSDALATLGAVHALWGLAFTLFLGLGLGTLSTVARAQGAGDPRRAAHTAAQGCLAASLGALLLIGAGAGASSWLARVSSPLDSIGAKSYAAWILASTAGQGVATIAVFSLHAVGANRRALWAGAAFPLTNLVLDPLAITLWGLPGAGFATFLASLLSLGASLLLLTKTLDLRLADFLPSRGLLEEIGAVGGPRSLDHLCRNAGMLGVVALLGFAGGAPAVAAHAAVIALLLLLIFPGVALGQATAAFVAQNLGAGDPDRAWKGAWTAVGLYALPMALAAVLARHHAGAWLEWLLVDPDSRALAARFVHVLAPALPFLGVALIVGKAAGGARRSGEALRYAAFAHLVLQLPLALLLARSLGPEGVFLAVAIAFTTQGVLDLWLLLRVSAGTSDRSSLALGPMTTGDPS